MSARRSVTRRVSPLRRAEPPAHEERKRRERDSQDEPEPGRKKEREGRGLRGRVYARRLVTQGVRRRTCTLATDLSGGVGRRRGRGGVGAGSGSLAAHPRRG